MWSRLLHDFWPLDASSVGPNLVASVIAFTAGWLLKGRQVVKGFHTKLDAQHAAHMAAFEEHKRHVGARIDRIARDHGGQLAEILDVVHQPPPVPAEAPKQIVTPPAPVSHTRPPAGPFGPFGGPYVG